MAVLICMTENGEQHYPLFKNITRIGSDPTADVSLTGGEVATDHAHILREGPMFGVHALLWCDSFNNVSRSLDRQSLRDVEMRVLFHMNATDSTNLIDSPLASRLGVHRGLLSDEGQGRLEKFRPYGLPSPQWLAEVAEQLQRRLS